jgi:hypothetical protein
MSSLIHHQYHHFLDPRCFHHYLNHHNHNVRSCCSQFCPLVQFGTQLNNLFIIVDPSYIQHILSSIYLLPVQNLGFRFRFLAGAGNFSLHTCIQNGSGANHLLIQWVTGTISLGVKRQGREADHSPQSSAEVKNVWSYTSAPQYTFMAWCLVKHRDKFTFYLYFTPNKVRKDIEG